jgi:sugar phosphate isomerase/epimerase
MTDLMTRRTLFGSLALAAAAQAQQGNQRKEWKPKLGILGPYTENNVKFARAEGFSNMILSATQRSTLTSTDLTDREIENIKKTLSDSGMSVSAFQASQNHIAPDLDRRKKDNDYFVKLIELAGKLGVPYIGTSSGKDPAKSFDQQVADIVSVYTEKYFPACEKNRVRILWEPYPLGANIATSPAGFEALFKGFGNSPYVGLQYDPSHLVWQMMDPIQTARDFAPMIYDVHLKDTEVRWDVLRRGGINPVNNARWWSYRLPGLGSINWAEFFSVLQNAGYQGAMSIEHEDALYGSPNRPGPDFSEDYKMGFRMAYRYCTNTCRNPNSLHGGAVSKYFAAFHNEYNAPHSPYIVERIALSSDQVRLESRSDRADMILQSERFRRERRSAHNCIPGTLPGLAHPINKLLGITPVRARHGIGPEYNLYLQCLSPLDHVRYFRQRLLHKSEPFLGEVSTSQKVRLVVQIIVQHQQIWIEVHPAFRHQLKHAVVQECTVLNRCAAGIHRRARSVGSMRMHHRPLAQSLRFAAHRPQLLVGHGLSAAFANALGGE